MQDWDSVSDSHLLLLTCLSSLVGYCEHGKVVQKAGNFLASRATLASQE